MKKKYYNMYDKEVIDMMVDVFGIEAVINFCEVNAFKYRMRIGFKENKVDEELAKERWYLDKVKELRDVVLKNMLNEYPKGDMHFTRESRRITFTDGELLDFSFENDYFKKGD